MWDIIAPALGSQAFVQAIATTLAALAMRVGFQLDAASIAVLISPFFAAIGMTGVQHLAAARVAVANINASSPPDATVAVQSVTVKAPEIPSLARAPERGAVRLGMMLALAAGLAVACTATQRRETIAATVLAADHADSALATYSKAHELELIAAATSQADGAAKLAAFRATIDKVSVAIATVYLAAAAAELALDAPSLASMLSAAQQVATQLAAVKKGTP